MSFDLVSQSIVKKIFRKTLDFSEFIAYNENEDKMFYLSVWKYLVSVKSGESYHISGSCTRGESYRISGSCTRGESYRISGSFV